MIWPLRTHRWPILAFAFLGLLTVGGCASGTQPHVPLPQSLSPGMIVPAPMAHTVLQGSTAMRSPITTKSDIQGLNWQQIPGSASQVAASADGSIWVLADQPSGADKYIWRYANGSWSNVSGLAAQLAVAPDGTLYAVNSGGGAYSYKSGAWTALGGGASAVTAAADNSIYVISNGGAGADKAIWHNVNGVWSQAAGSGVSLAGSMDPNYYYFPPGNGVFPGGTYIQNSQGAIYYENPDASFKQLPGNASALAPSGTGGVFALGYPADSAGTPIYYYNLNTPGWKVAGGAGVSISSNAGYLYVIGGSGAIYKAALARVAPPPPSQTVFSATSMNVDGIATGPDGNVWFTEPLQHKLAKITPSGMVTDYIISGGADAARIALGPDGNMWFTDYDDPSLSGASSAIGKMSLSGSVTLYPLPDLAAKPWGIAAGPDGNMWFTQLNGKIGKISMTGAMTFFPPLPFGSSPNDIIAGPDGNLWFCSPSGAGHDAIGKITTAGTITLYVTPTDGTYMQGIAAGPDGNLWFAEGAVNKIGKITPAGAIIEYPIPTFAMAPDGIANGPDGNLWFTENNFLPGSQTASQIGKITTSGVITEYPITSYPGNQITLGSDGNLWITEWISNQVVKIIP